MSTSVDDLVAAATAAAGSVVDPELQRSLAELDMVRQVEVADGRAVIGIALTIVGCPMADRIEREVTAAASAVPGIDRVHVELTVMSTGEREALLARLRSGRTRSTTPFTPGSLTRVIAVTSGKGGVGKSTVTANLAVATARRGLRVGLVDTDVHGFSIPALLGLVDDSGFAVRPTRIDDLVLPPVAHGVKGVSIGMFLPEGSENSAVSWRGPLLHRTVEQFITEVYFGDLDVLFLDLPPGTGDVAISVGHLLPHSEVLVVTTPQRAASGVAVRSGLLARTLEQKVIGIVETMAADSSGFAPFGTGGGAAVAAQLSAGHDEVPLLGSIPFSVPLREAGDAGLPIGIAAPFDPAARAFDDLAQRLTTRPRGLAGRRLSLSVR
ncbi:Mrp/NBP35 family ATP-binding protein [Herbiconiux daphne]|uniref:Iron-sulfur cluster carrier protein n=1 Tax=Herbiconiux daphne TaxID=2970914 RepID=A0ABT2H7Y8_9MICO|nr:Mrp/NBP35 family ATP-binding protein [Herbiconiux daphne]MCS5736080.1 Mrp/NBP35 family ATP-binding protein [Herbiconiux daphne]